MSEQLQSIREWGELAAIAATAFATFFLWRVTRLLAKETRRLADATGQPQVVASLLPNRWSMRHTDLVVENTGNATAFDVAMEFVPELQGSAVPFQRISLLKPGQSLRSYLNDFSGFPDGAYQVTITWGLQPHAKDRQTLEYTLTMGDFSGLRSLGGEPIVQLAKELKNIREDWQGVARGSRRIQVETFDGDDQREEGHFET